MGNTIAAKQILAALGTARGLGVQEESFQLVGVEVTVRSLRPHEYEAILGECEGLDELPYLHALQRGYGARGLVEINGLDLREVDFVEDEVLDERNKPKKTRLERHEWVSRHVLSTWSRETLYVLYRKVEDANQKAKEAAKQGVSFLIPEETDEERVRNLLSEAKDLLGELPPGVRRRVLEDAGLVEQSTAEEIRQAQQTLDKVRQDAPPENLGSSGPAGEAQEPEEPEEPGGPTPQDFEVLQQGLQQTRAASPAEAPPARQPLNRTVVVGPTVPLSAPADLPVPPRAAAIAAQAAEVERDLGISSGLDTPVPLVFPRPPPVELRGSGPKVAPVEPPSVVGVNSRFRPPSRGT